MHSRMNNSVTTLQNAKLQQSSYDDYVTRLKSVNDSLKAIEDKTNFLSIMGKSEYTDSDTDNFAYLLVRIKFAIGMKSIVESLSLLEDFSTSNFPERKHKCY